MIGTITSFLSINALALGALFYLGRDQSALVWIAPILTYIVFVYCIGRRAMKNGKTYHDVLRLSYIFSFAVVYIMGVGGSLLMSMAEGQGYVGLWWGISTGWIIGLLACLPAMVLVNQFFGRSNKPPNKAL